MEDLDKETLEKLREIYSSYSGKDDSSLPILLYRCIRLLEVRIDKYGVSVD